MKIDNDTFLWKPLMSLCPKISQNLLLKLKTQVLKKPSVLYTAGKF